MASACVFSILIVHFRMSLFELPRIAKTCWIFFFLLALLPADFSLLRALIFSFLAYIMPNHWVYSMVRNPFQNRPLPCLTEYVNLLCTPLRYSKFFYIIDYYTFLFIIVWITPAFQNRVRAWFSVVWRISGTQIITIFIKCIKWRLFISIFQNK